MHFLLHWARKACIFCQVMQESKHQSFHIACTPYSPLGDLISVLIVHTMQLRWGCPQSQTPDFNVYFP